MFRGSGGLDRRQSRPPRPSTSPAELPTFYRGVEAAGAREGEERPVLTAIDVLRTLRNLANPNPAAVAPTAVPCTYDRGFMDSRFADDALP